jgi:hydroxymethylpyrimidine/phosphomethylpyrimidine kinase
VNPQRPNLLLVAASDSSGGSGLQADLRACAAFGVHPLTVLTAVTAQAPEGLRRLQAVSAEMVAEQLAAVEGLPIAAVKIGVVPTAGAVEVLADWLATRGLPRVVDPVAATSGGEPLGDEAGFDAVARRLVAGATLVTPNHPELRRLAPGKPDDEAGRIAAARELGARAVLVKDGHGRGELCEDLLVLEDRVERFSHPRRTGRPVRGTGCLLAAAVAAGLARGEALEAAVRRGIEHVQDALENASPLGERVGVL